MNEKFLSLPQEKKMKIINAAMEVFARCEYKRASTDEMAAKAGISKGLLFYYFHNKKELYLYLFDYCEQALRDQIFDDRFLQITDFFELIEYASEKKLEMINKIPYLMDFVMKLYLSNEETVSGEMRQRLQKTISGTYGTYFKNIDFKKFRDGVDIEQLLHMLTWMTEGYIHEKQRIGNGFNLQEIMEEFKKWENMFRKISYKEEYINEYD